MIKKVARSVQKLVWGEQRAYPGVSSDCPSKCPSTVHIAPRNFLQLLETIKKLFTVSLLVAMMLSFSLAFFKIKFRFVLSKKTTFWTFSLRTFTSGRLPAAPAAELAAPLGASSALAASVASTALAVSTASPALFYSSQLALRGTYATAPSLYGWQLANIPVSPNFNPNCISS